MRNVDDIYAILSKINGNLTRIGDLIEKVVVVPDLPEGGAPPLDTDTPYADVMRAMMTSTPQMPTRVVESKDVGVVRQEISPNVWLVEVTKGDETELFVDNPKGRFRAHVTDDGHIVLDDFIG